MNELQVVADLAPQGALAAPTARPRRPRGGELATNGLSAVVAALVVAVGLSTAPALGFALAFGAFVLTAATLGRRARWGAMLPFASALGDLLTRALAGAIAWLLVDVSMGELVPVTCILLAVASATAAATLMRRVGAPAAKRLVVIGNATSADHLRAELRSAKLTGHEVVGVVDSGLAGGGQPEGLVPAIGSVGQLDELILLHDVDVLLIDRDASRGDVFEQVADRCLHLDVVACELTQFYEDTFGHVPVTEIDSAWFRCIMHPRFRQPDTIAKRALDLTVVLLGGLVFVPVIALCALAIKLHDGGPVLFRQRRIGSRGNEFTLLKLRTMRVAAAEARWSSADDDRITAIGRLLRRTHLDEVPQLINVLRGEMSIVGPRPEQPAFVARLEHALPHYSRRHLIKPGLTGWAQVRCGYAGSDTGSAWKLCHDLFYLKHQSLWLDLAILAETARTLVADRQFPTRGGAALIAVPAADEAGALIPRAVGAD
jgi:exopolysaccharide biosynthesis polyprenyl glycosylphosphotransferase